jgi:hypothetical protein
MAKQTLLYTPDAIRWQVTDFVNADSTNAKGISGEESPEGESLVKALLVTNTDTVDISFDIGFLEDATFYPMFRVVVPANAGGSVTPLDLLRYADMKKITELDPNGKEMLSLYDNGYILAAKPVTAVPSGDTVRFFALYKPF